MIHKSLSSRALRPVVFFSVALAGLATAAPSEAHSHAAADTPPPAQARAQWSIAGKVGAVKILVRKDGWYSIPLATLRRAGLKVSNLRDLQLYAEGRQVSIAFSSLSGTPTQDSGARHEPTAQGSLQFYGTALDTPTTDAHTYWLLQGSRPGLRIKSYSREPDTSSARAYFMSTVEKRPRTVYFSTLLTNGGNNWFGPPLTTKPVDVKLSMPYPYSGPGAMLEVALQGVTKTAHTVKVQLNGGDLGTIAFTSTDHAVKDFTVPSANLRQGSNSVTLIPAGTSGDASLLEYVRLIYPALPFAGHHPTLRFSGAAGSTALVDIPTRNESTRRVRVLDVTNPWNPVELGPLVPTAVGTSTKAPPLAVAIPTTPSGTHTLIAAEPRGMLTPAQIIRHRPSRLHDSTNAADLVVISPASFKSALQPLIKLRRQQGLKVSLIDVQSIFDEFGYGVHGPQAIKDFLVWAATRWKVKPRYVLIAGTASYDPRNYEHGPNTDLVPTQFVDATFSEAPSDEWLVDFNGDNLPDLALGRLSARTPAQLKTMVGKIVSYSPSKVPASALLIAGPAHPDDTADFTALTQNLQPLFPQGVATQTLTPANSSAGQLQSAIHAGIDAGPRFVNYIGHGSVDLWGSSLFTTADASGLANDTRLSVFVMMTCLNGYFVSPTTMSLGEALLDAPHGGAVAVWSSTGETSPEPQALLNAALYRQLFSHPGARLGDVVRLAAQSVTDPDVRRTWVLLGDPTTVVWP